jgi:hypothetical protein
MGAVKSTLATGVAMRATGARLPASLYVAGPFSMGYLDLFTFLIPLYGLSLGLECSLGIHNAECWGGTVLSMLSIAATPLLGAWFGLLLSARAWPARGRDPAGHLVGAGARGGWLAPDRAAAQLYPDPAHNGRDRRPLRNEPKLSDLCGLHVVAPWPTRADHPPATACQRRCLTVD